MNKRKTMTYAVAAGVAATLTLAGCNGGDKDPTTTPSPSGSATTRTPTSATVSSSPSATVSAPTDIPVAARANTDEGAIAFVRFYFEQLNAAYTKPDATLLPLLTTSACTSCAGLQAGVAEIVADGQRMKSDLVAPISTAAIAPEAPNGQTWIKFTLTQLTVPVIDKSGNELEGQKASSVGKIVSVIREGDQWKIHGIANQS